MTKPDCYKCKWKKDVIGSTHISCHHPTYKEIHKNPLLNLIGTLASIGREEPIQLELPGVKVIGDPVGIRKGWFNHPLNFDPTWLISCNGFEKN